VVRARKIKEDLVKKSSADIKDPDHRPEHKRTCLIRKNDREKTTAKNSKLMPARIREHSGF